MRHATILIAALILCLGAGTTFAQCPPNTENAIHQETVACYNECIRILNENQKQECIRACVIAQNEARRTCHIECTNIAGYRVFCR